MLADFFFLPLSTAQSKRTVTSTKKPLSTVGCFQKYGQTKKYIPSKRTVVALCLAPNPSREDADRLLSSAGYSLSRADDFDLVIAFCIEKKIFDFFDINEVLV